VVLVLRARLGVRGYVAVLRDRDASDCDLLAQTGLETTPGGAGTVRRWAGRFLRLGLPHVRHRHESLRPFGVFRAGFVARSAGRVPAGQLACDAVECEAAAFGGDVVFRRLYFAVYRWWPFRNIPGAP